MEDSYSDLTKRWLRQVAMAEPVGRAEGLPLIHVFLKNNAKTKDLFSWQDTDTQIVGFNHTEAAKESIKAPGPVKCR